MMDRKCLRMESGILNVQPTTPSRTRFGTPAGEDDCAAYSQTSTYTTPGSTMGECAANNISYFQPLGNASRACSPDQSSSVHIPRDGPAVQKTLQTSRTPQERASRPSRDSRAKRRSSQAHQHGSLSKPLSELGRENPAIVVADVAAFSMRSPEVRRSEAAAAGKVKRPLNAFMLYRKAYQNVAKTQSKRDNHQQVSSICGESWKLCEPRSVIDHFNHLASVEKQLHERAFPEYRYDPVPAKRFKDSAEAGPTSTSENSEANSAARAATRRVTRGRGARSASRLRRSFAEDDYSRATDVRAESANVDPWYDTPGVLFPGLGEYGTHPYPSLGGQASGDTAHVGGQLLHGVYPFHEGYLEQTVSFGSFPPLDDSCVDPLLRQCAFDSGLSQLPVSASGGSLCWSIGPGSVMPDLDANGAHNAYLRGLDSDWTVEQLGEGSHFDDWMRQDGSHTTY